MGQKHYGYKDHINIDKDTKLIVKQTCSAADVHDSQALQELSRAQDVGGKEVGGDGAYRSDEQEQHLQKSKYNSQIHGRAHRGKPLTQEQKNQQQSQVARARLELVFGQMKNSMDGIFVCSIGVALAKVNVALMKLIDHLYLNRIEVLIRHKLIEIDRITAPQSAQVYG